MKIYCDMDGVLVDFVRGSQSILGHAFESSVLDSVKEQDYDVILGLQERFWEELPPMPDMRQLWRYINKYHANILSAKASWERKRNTKEYSRIGKLVWVKQHLQIPMERIHIVRRDQKQDYAVSEQGQNILIDDHPKNIREFTAAGGIGIHHVSAEMTIRTLQQLGL